MDSVFSDDEWEKDATCDQEFMKPVIVSSALSALMGNYGSDVSDFEGITALINFKINCK